MTGKDPHRPEGKTKDAEHMARTAATRDLAGTGPSPKLKHDMDMREKEMHGGPPGHIEAEEQLGGSRPRVESLVKDAIVRREEREEE